jgi:hypothetical protein
MVLFFLMKTNYISEKLKFLTVFIPVLVGPCKSDFKTGRLTSRAKFSIRRQILYAGPRAFRRWVYEVGPSTTSSTWRLTPRFNGTWAKFSSGRDSELKDCDKVSKRNIIFAEVSFPVKIWRQKGCGLSTEESSMTIHNQRADHDCHLGTHGNRFAWNFVWTISMAYETNTRRNIRWRTIKNHDITACRNYKLPCPPSTSPSKGLSEPFDMTIHWKALVVRSTFWWYKYLFDFWGKMHFLNFSQKT